jgi:hypothetical protein
VWPPLEEAMQFAYTHRTSIFNVHRHEGKTWRHLYFFQPAANLTARAPRCKCDERGVKQVAVPWTREAWGAL